MAGVTDEGFEAETVDTIKTAIEQELQTRFGASFNVRPTSVAGIVIGVMSQKLADLWEAAEAIYNSQYPETAFGASLDQLGLLTGTQRDPARRSEVVCGVTGTPGTIIPTGSRISNTDTGSFWRLQTENGNITIPAASATTGTFESEEFGEIAGFAATLTTIDTVVSGWTAVSNPLDATLGADLETDAAYRLRRISLLTQQGKGTFDALRADVLALDGIESAYVFENVTDTTNSDGLPGHSFEVVVLGTATEAVVAQAIWDSKPLGISAYGVTTGIAVDSLSESHVVAYTEATEQTVYVSLTATTGTGYGGLTADVAEAIVTFADDEYTIGSDVYVREIYGPVFDIPGVLDVTDMKVGFTASPTGFSNLSVGLREIAVFDTARIIVSIA